ncbi:MAG: hypothetical protein V5A25_09490 [Halovenus sp.]
MDSDPGECHRRNCHNDAVFLVREKYLEETGHGLVEATARLCQEHTHEESPANIDPITPEYLFEVTALVPSEQDAQSAKAPPSDQLLTQCPDCGWTGDLSVLSVEDGTRSCPVCGDDIEIIE